MKIAEKLQKILREAGWSQEDLARRLGVSFKAVNAWVTGKTEPREGNLAKIEQFYFDVVGRTEVEAEFLRTTEKKALRTRLELDELLENQEMLKTTALNLTYHTNTIEGSTMTIEDVEKVLEDDRAVIPDRTIVEQLEARNHRAAFNFLLAEMKRQGRNFKWSIELIQAIHLRLMNGILESAGQYRNHGVRIMGSRIPLANYQSVPRKINELVEFMNTPSENLIEKMAITHARFEQIHPFGDGNGRTGRLIMFGQALKGKLVPPLVIKERKRAYYKYLEIAQMREEYGLLRLFIAESVLFTDELIK